MVWALKTEHHLEYDMWGLFGALFFLTNSEIILETEAPLEILQHKMEVARDGTILVATRLALYHWGQNGRIINVLRGTSPEKPFGFIMTFHYDPRKKNYWIIDVANKSSLFFDGEGRFIGQCCEGNQPGTGGEGPVYFRDLITVGTRIFVLDGSALDPWDPELRKMLQQVVYEVREDGIRVQRVGLPFGRFTELQREYQYNFKRHWIVQDGYTRNFFLVNQLSTRIRQYSPYHGEEIEDGLVLRERTIGLYMPGWVEPPSQKNRRKKPKPTQYDTFSRITGFYALGDDLVVGYSIPDPDHPGQHELALQKQGKDGEVKGRTEVVRGIFVGVYRKNAYVLREEEGKEKPIYRIQKIPL